MKNKSTLLIFLCAFCFSAHAEQAVVIDSQSVGEASKAEVKGATPSESQADANAANREHFLKGGKMSPREKAAVAKAEIAEANLQEGAAFRSAYSAKPGVMSLPSGVQYRILKTGSGIKPTEDSTVRCRYKGTLINGATIDKSDTKKPSTLRVSGFLEGLKQAVKLMPTGSKWEIVIPPQLAYGAFGNRGVGPNAVLIYEMEILGVK